MKSINLKKVRASIGRSAVIARKWFEEKSFEILKKEFDKHGSLKLKDKRTGAVYAYFSKSNEVLYVGETGGGVKERTHFQTSRHTNAKWWGKWTHMRFLQVPIRTDRLVLELFLILDYQPTYNKKPGPRHVKQFFS